MKSQPSDSPKTGASSRSDSRDCIDVFYDGEGDTTVRPMSPESIKRVLAEREKLKRWQESIDAKNPDQNPPHNDQPCPAKSAWVSRDCIDVVYDGEGDTTVRPIPPEWLPQALAEIEKLKRWGAWPYGNKPDQNPPKDDSPSL